MTTIVSVAIVLSLLVFVHELGHFLGAKLAGIPVVEFGFGFPPRLLVLGERKGTLYTLNWIPVGGFVRMLGEDDPSQPGGFAGQPKLRRVVTLLAGPAMNFLLAFLLFTCSFLYGVPTPVSTVVGILDVLPGSPAEQAGLKLGDIIEELDGRAISSSKEMQDHTSNHLGESIAVRVRRDGEGHILSVLARPEDERPANQGPMGVVIYDRPTKLISVSYPLGKALVGGAQQTAFSVVATFYLPVLVLRGIIPVEEVRPVGPAGIARLTADAAQQVSLRGWWYPLIQYTGLFSAALAVTNVLPLPALDGGRLFFILVEAIRRKRIDPRKEGLVHAVGIMILIGLMVIITYMDITSPAVGIDWNQFGF